MKTLTNKLEISVDYATADNDFDFFLIRSSDIYINKGAKVLDLQDDKRKVKSIVFDDGASLFVMTGKGAFKLHEFQSLVNDESLHISKIEASNIKEYILAKLFLNSLCNYDSDMFSFNNLTGKFFVYLPEWIAKNRKSFKALNIDIRLDSDKHPYLSANATTFTSIQLIKSKKILETYPRYSFGKDGTLKREIVDGQSYVRKSLNGKKAEVPFMSFKKGESKSTKAFIVSNVIERLNSKYAKYIKLAFSEFDIERKVDSKRDEMFFEKAAELFNGKTINIVDLISAPEDREVAHDFVIRMKDLLPATSFNIVSKPVKSALNIVVLHDEDYYLEKEMDDPYKSFDRSTPIQCVTLEDVCYKNSDVILRTIVKELEIKSEIISERRIILDDWSSFETKKPYIFGMEVDRVPYFLEIDPEGRIKTIKQTGLFGCFKEKVYNDLSSLMMSVKAKGKMLVADNLGNVNLISNTGLSTLPYPEVFSDESPRGKRARELYLSGVSDINFYIRDGKRYYNCGAIGKGMNAVLPTGSNIYRIDVCQGDDIVSSMLETMSVQFVKYNNYTALPYPFKYLREWIQMETYSSSK